MLQRHLAAFAAAAISLFAGAQTYDLCEFWPLAVGNKWEYTIATPVDPLEVLDTDHFQGLDIYRLHDRERSIGIGASIAHFFVTFTDDGMYLRFTLEDLLRSVSNADFAIPLTFTDGGIYPYGDRNLRTRVKPLSGFVEEKSLQAVAAVLPAETPCVAFDLEINSQYTTSFIFGQGYGPVYWDSPVIPTLVDATTCTTSIPPSPHRADTDHDNALSLSELLRLVQLFNSGEFDCDSTSEDGFHPGEHADYHTCFPHSADYNPQDWVISLSELLRAIQFYNAGGYHPCPDAGSEDGYCPGAA